MVAIAKLAAGSVALATLVVDTAAEKIAIIAAGITGLGLIWKHLIRPAGSLLKHGVAIVKRTASAVDALETLPKWRKEHDERLAAVEAEVGIVHNDVAAIRRELGIGDDMVRSVVRDEPPPHEARSPD